MGRRPETAAAGREPRRSRCRSSLRELVLGPRLLRRLWGPLTIAGSRKRERCYGCSWHRNRGNTICANALLESVSVVDARVLAEIERTVLTPEARRFVLETAEDALLRNATCASRTGADRGRALSRVRREIQHLVRAIEQGTPPAPLLEQLRVREQERETIEAELAATRTQECLRTSIGAGCGVSSPMAWTTLAACSRPIRPPHEGDHAAAA